MITADEIKQVIQWLESLERSAKMKKQPAHQQMAALAIKVIKQLYGGDL